MQAIISFEYSIKIPPGPPPPRSVGPRASVEFLLIEGKTHVLKASRININTKNTYTKCWAVIPFLLESSV